MSKSKTNFERLIQLAEDVFSARTVPEQLDVDEKVISRKCSLPLYRRLE